MCERHEVFLKQLDIEFITGFIANFFIFSTVSGNFALIEMFCL